MIYAVSDIHGDLAMYSHIVNMLKGDDLLYIVGDVIDRGSSGITILQDIMKRPNVELLLGNHENYQAGKSNIALQYKEFKEKYEE